jgi:uncharacterized protein with PQ loop repeat
MDHNVSKTMNGFLIIANIINLLYNVPQIITTYKRKSTKDFSGWFLFLRFIGNFIWIGYAIEIDSLLMLINNIVTVVSSGFIGYYKVKEIYNEYKLKQYKLVTNDDDIINSDNNINLSNIENDHLISNIENDHSIIDLSKFPDDKNDEFKEINLHNN